MERSETEEQVTLVRTLWMRDDDLRIGCAELFEGFATGRNYIHTEEHQHCEDANQRQDRSQLAIEVTIRANANGVPHFLHLSRALVILEHFAAQPPRVRQAQERRGDHHDDGDLLETVQTVSS